MKHPLELENETLRELIEATYNDISEVDEEIKKFAIFELAHSMTKRANQPFSVMNGQTLDIMITWGNK